MADIPASLIEYFETKKAAMSARPQEVQDKIKAYMMEMFMDESKKAEMMAMQCATFKAADTNEDGMLDLAEFVNYTNMMGKNFNAALGFPNGEDKTAEQCEAAWKAHQVCGKHEGVHDEDIHKVMAW